MTRVCELKLTGFYFVAVIYTGDELEHGASNYFGARGRESLNLG
jgi:hypothetical protein